MRKAPPEHANEFDLDERRIGNDGNMWKSVKRRKKKAARKTTRRVRTGKRRRRRRRTIKRSTSKTKKGGAPPIDIKAGDILVMNFGGNVPLTSYKHVAVALRPLLAPIGTANKQEKTFLPLAHCVGQGCIVSGLEYTPNENNKTIWVLRYRGPRSVMGLPYQRAHRERTAEELREWAAYIADRWASSGKLKFSRCRTLRALLPCFAKQADRKTGIRYARALTTDSALPRYDNEKYTGMFCSKFGLAVWMAALGSFNTDEGHYNWAALDKCLPLKPSNCTPGDLMSLPEKSHNCWETVGEFKGWGRWLVITQN